MAEQAKTKWRLLVFNYGGVLAVVGVTLLVAVAMPVAAVLLCCCRCAGILPLSIRFMCPAAGRWRARSRYARSRAADFFSSIRFSRATDGRLSVSAGCFRRISNWSFIGRGVKAARVYSESEC